MTNVSVADAAPATTARRSRWRRAPGWLGVGGALVGLAAYALPWYTAGGGATYSGVGLLLSEYIPYDIPAYGTSYGPPQECAGALSGFSLPVGLMGGLLVAALAISLALGWRPMWRGVAFTLAAALLVASWSGLFILFPLISSLLRTDYPQGPALGPNCPPIGAHELGLNVLLPCLLVVAVASLWRMALSLPSAPWLLGVCAALGVLGFAAPWDLSVTPGVWYIGADAVCAVASIGARGGYNEQCVSPAGPVPPMSRIVMATFLPVFVIQLALLLAVLVVAIMAARRRTAGWRRALQVVGLAAGVLGLIGGLVEAPLSVELLVPGASIVTLGFLLLTIFAGRAGEESQALRQAAPAPEGAGGAGG